MIQLVGMEPCGPRALRLQFSDGSEGVYDFSRLVDAATAMTAPLGDPEFFARCFIEAGGLAWPNGFDLCADWLRQKLRARAELRSSSGVA